MDQLKSALNQCLTLLNWVKSKNRPAYYLLLAAAAWIVRELTFPYREKKLTGDVCVITGGAGGIGRLMALRLALKEGCKLALIDLNGPLIQQVADEILSKGGVAKGYKLDVTDGKAVRETAAQIFKDFGGRVDILINNAGIVSGEKLLEESDFKTELTLKVNTLAPMLMIKAFLPKMLEHNKGHIVQIASSAGRLGVNGLVSYCASKFGAVGLDESLRGELAVIAPALNTMVVCPMYINTGMFDGAKMKSTIPLLNPIVQTLMPVLEPDYVANKIVTGIKRNQTSLVMPRMAYLSPLLRCTIPTGLLDKLQLVLGVSRSMEDFKQTRAIEPK